MPSLIDEMINGIASALDGVHGKRLFLQIPEGLKTYTKRIVSFLEGAGNDVFVYVTPCFGACDIPVDEAKLLGADMIVHLGHNKFYKHVTDFPVVYVPISIPIDVDDEKLHSLPKRVGILTTVQHLKYIDKIKNALLRAGKQPIVGGQILGCWTENAKKIKHSVDCFLYVGSGTFHPTALRTEKPVFVYDVEKNELIDASDLVRREEMKRYARIEKFRSCKSVGILVSTKLGQFNITGAIALKNELESRGKKAFIFVSNIIKKEYVMGMGVDCLVNTACPRIVDDDFGVPIVNLEDAILAMGDENESVEKRR